MLLLDVYQTLIHVLVEGLMWIIDNAGGVISAVWSLIGGAAGIMYQYFVNVGGCFGNMVGCDKTKGVYRCCGNPQIWTEQQCATPSYQLDGEFMTDIARSCRTATATEATAFPDHLDFIVGNNIAFYLPHDREKWWSWDTLYENGAFELLHTHGKLSADCKIKGSQLQAALIHGFSEHVSKGGIAKSDHWPYMDELDDDVYKESTSGLEHCKGQGAVSTWVCEDSDHSYFNAGGGRCCPPSP